MKNVEKKRSFVREHAGGLVLAVLLHAGLLGFLFVGYLKFRSEPEPVQPQTLAIQGAVVDEKLIAAENRRLDEEARREEQREREEAERAEQLKREREAEEQRLEEVKQQRAAEEEKQRQLTVEREKAEELKRTREALEAKRREEQEAKVAVERRRKEEEQKRKAAAEAKQRAEREAELRRQMGEEERRTAAVDSGQLAQYIAQIQARVQRAWNRPPSANPGLNCLVHVTQVPGGEVVGVRVGECNGDEIVRQSIEAAVYRASPLPEPSDPSLFERNLVLNFRPTE